MKITTSNSKAIQGAAIRCSVLAFIGVMATLSAVLIGPALLTPHRKCTDQEEAVRKEGLTELNAILKGKRHTTAPVNLPWCYGQSESEITMAQSVTAVRNEAAKSPETATVVLAFASVVVALLLQFLMNTGAVLLRLCKEIISLPVRKRDLLHAKQVP